MSLALPGFEECAAKGADIVLTPDDVAADVVRHFRPTGRILDPCKGEGAFLRHMPGAEWCEIREGRDFFAWTKPVDWIVSNPPYSVFWEFMEHSFSVADNIVYAIPLAKLFHSGKRLRGLFDWGGIPGILILGPGRNIGFPLGFAVAAVHMKRGYDGETRFSYPAND